ncbi:hypothetical protein Verru16b_00292 [Lacunisphaera limnophila]|uniref:AsmA family protein n=1 Tax=Lacunisphaera limnophila TaxID=1838286 RepID=A0A1I7PHZ8_9BACT|nr:hypothetical protein [Lacunisphaera limnophila]AOS43249.1 hypothetical protein Verru16b_00292 [Lacunisphaera limnophila]
MKKIILILGGGLLLVLVGGYVVAAFFLGSIVKSGVNNFGPKLTQTKVELKAATVSPLTGSGTLRGLTVGNPAGWSAGDAFTLGHVHVDVDPMSIFGDHIVINEITIDAPVFNYETKIVASNIKDLLKNIEAFTGSGGQEPATKDGKTIKFVVKKFRLTNAQATIGAAGAALPVPLPPISLDNLGVAEGGITADQMASALMKNVLGSIVAGTANALGQLGGTAGRPRSRRRRKPPSRWAKASRDFSRRTNNEVASSE